MNIHPVPFVALGGLFEQDDVDAAMRVISKAAGPGGDFFPLPEEVDFQKALAAHEGASHAVAVNSCGTALDLCMMVLGIKPGDEVITTPLTFVCTATCAAALGAKVIFADIDAVTMNLDPEKVRAKITGRTRAVIPVHFAGLACDIAAFDGISRDTGIPIIYDAAHAVGALYRGKPIGGSARASCYSFQSNKNITTLGEGGAVTTNDAEFAEKVRQKKTFGYVYGATTRVVTIGFNYRMNKAQYAVGLTQLAKAERIVSARQERMARMDEVLAGVGEIIRPAGHGAGHGSHLYAVRLDTDKVKFGADALQKHLKEVYQVGTVKHYPAVWSWEAFGEIDHDKSDCAIAAKACEQVFSLPIFPDTTFEDLEYVGWAIKESIAALRSQ
jgi:dTDP-4-amino-4,6-dideoxygalactose transaminase